MVIVLRLREVVLGVQWFLNVLWDGLFLLAKYRHGYLRVGGCTVSKYGDDADQVAFISYQRVKSICCSLSILRLRFAILCNTTLCYNNSAAVVKSCLSFFLAVNIPAEPGGQPGIFVNVIIFVIPTAYSGTLDP